MYPPEAIDALTVAVANELGLTIRLMVQSGGWEAAERAGLVSGRDATAKGRTHLRSIGTLDELEAQAFPRPPSSPTGARVVYPSTVKETGVASDARIQAAVPDETILKPCPFCGGSASFERIGTHRQSCIVVCDDCGCRLESGDVGERSGTSWNRRAS